MRAKPEGLMSKTATGFSIIRLLLALALLSCSSSVTAQSSVPADSLSGKLIVGYQGWFGCPGDYGGNWGWIHWFTDNIPDAAHLRVDMLPKVSEYPKDGLCPTDLKTASGEPIYLFTSQSPGVVDTHFRWMAQYGIDGAAVQRFLSVVANPASLPRWDHLLSNERAAAEHNGRVFFISYDISGANPGTVINDIARDWRHLVVDLRITDSPQYLRDHGKPVVELWGFGTTDRPGTPVEVRGLIYAMKTGAWGLPPVTVVGGVAENWRTLNGSSKTDPAWTAAYDTFDVISPWFTGRFRDPQAAQSYLADRAGGDLAATRRLGIGYMPDVFPGFSWTNQMRLTGHQSPLDQIPRDCGNLEMAQVKTLLGLGVNMLYVGMFDEVDEGTAIFKVAARPDELPVGVGMVPLREGGCQMGSDGYLRVTGEAAQMLHAEGRGR